MKIKLYENKKLLNEAFSPSMPKWLKAKLLADSNHFSNSTDDHWAYFKHPDSYAATQAQLKYASRNNMMQDLPDAEFKSRKRANKDGTIPDYYDLFQAFRDAEVNMDSANFISDGIPTKSSDDRLKEPNIPIFYLKSGPSHHQVYAVGYNDYEIDYITGNPLKYTSTKELLGRTEDFCYLDKNDPSTFSTGRIKQRQDMQNSLTKDMSNYFRAGQIPSKSSGLCPRDSWKNNNPYVRTHLDKSGYAVYDDIVNSSPYAAKLKEAKAYRAADWLEECNDKLVKYQQEFINYISLQSVDEFKTAMKNISSRTYSSIFYKFSDTFASAVTRYNDFCEIVATGNIETIKYSLRNGDGFWLQSYLTDLDRLNKNFRSVAADWD